MASKKGKQLPQHPQQQATRHLEEEGDPSQLLKVEDLINLAMGPSDKNVVNFKMIQTVLFILAQQMRMLEQKVEVRMDDLQPEGVGSKTRIGVVSDEDSKAGGHVTGADEAKKKKGKKEGAGADADAVSVGGKSIESKQKDKKGAAGSGSGTSIAISGRTRVGSIEVVTAQEFAVLEAAVKALQEKGSLPPAPKLPDNKKLRSDIAKGNASLTDTMQAMQLSSRVQAAEAAIGNMAQLLTQLAASGALPQDVASKAATIQKEVQTVLQEVEGGAKGAGKAGAPAVAGAPTYPASGAADGPGALAASGAAAPQHAAGAPITPPLTKAELISRGEGALTQDLRLSNVTHADLDEALNYVRTDIINRMQQMTLKATNVAENAALNIKSITEKIDMATKLDSRITDLQTLVDDYAEQLTGFDSGLTSQMKSFQDQMATLRTDLQAGLTQLEQVNNNAETAAILELTERYEGLVTDLDNTLHSHHALTAFQQQLADELKNLSDAVEMMREQKADRDEVEDGLRDKADMSRLTGLVSEKDFQEARAELEARMQMCYDKFRKQDAVWMNVMNDFSQVIETKAELAQLMGVREEAQDELQSLLRKVQQLAKLLGDPKAAMITRKLAKDAYCGVCRVRALMEPTEPAQPIALPPLRYGTAPPGEKEPCLRSMLIEELIGDKTPKEEQHMCQRWVGGSHTMIGTASGRGHVSHELASAGLTSLPPVKRYLGKGTDGKLYCLEEDMQPCVECNLLSAEKDQPPGMIPGEAEVAGGDGDQDGKGRRVTMVDPSMARRVTVLDDKIPRAVDGEQLEGVPYEGGRRRSHSRRKSGAGDVPADGELFPSQKRRSSRLSKAAIYVENEREPRLTEVGETVQGRVTLVDEDAALAAALKHKLQEEADAKSQHETDEHEPLKP